VQEEVTGAVWRRLVDGSRELYETSFRPEALGRWYLETAEEWGNR